MPDTIDSNSVGLSFSEEVSLKTLPASPVFYGLEPNSFSDFGGEYAKTARRPINPGRQRRKGGITDLDASGGINHDLVWGGLQRMLQGFLFADMRAKDNTRPLNAAGVATTAVASPANTYAIVNGNALFAPNELVLAVGFNNPANNGLKLVTTATASLITVSQALVAEAAPPATAYLRAVGWQFASADASFTVTSGVAALVSAAKDMTTLGLNIGEWIFIGGDAVGEKFTANTQGYGRIKSITTTTITFDKLTFTPVADAGTGKTIRIFVGDFLRNEKTPSLIKRRSYTLQRTLGNDGVGIQSELLRGSIPNEITVNVPVPAADSKINLDMTFVSMDRLERTGTVGPLSATGGATLVDPVLEDFFNTSTHVFRQKLSIIDAANMNPSALFAYVQEITITIANGVAPTKAIGTLGAFNASTGLFEVDAEVTAYFSDVTAVAAIRNNADVTYDLILSKANQALVFDLPLVSLGGGRAEVELDQPIMLPLEQAASEGAAGYTLGLTFFGYVPNVGMAA